MRCHSLLLVAALAPALASGSPSRRSIADIQARREAEVLRRVEALVASDLGRHAEGMEVALDELRIHRDAPRPIVEVARATLTVSRLKVAGIHLSGTVEVHGLRLDYAALGVGRLRVLDVPRVLPQLTATFDDVATFLGAQGIRAPFVEVDPIGGSLVFGGRRPVRVLFHRSNPEVRVHGRFRVEGSRVGFAVSEVQVSETMGVVAGAIRRKVRHTAAATVDLLELLPGLEVARLDVAGGSVQVTKGDVVLFQQDLGPLMARVAD